MTVPSGSLALRLFGSMVIAVGLLACGKDKPKTPPAELAKQGAVMATVASLPRARTGRLS